MATEKAQASKESSFVWSDYEVELLLDITIEYRAQKMLSGIDWESVTSKYADIANRFIEVNESSTQLANNGSGNDGSDTESSSMSVMNSRETLLKRRALLDENLKNHKRKKLEKKVSPEAQFLIIAKEEMDMKKEFLKYQRELDAEHSHTMKTLTGTMEKLSSSIIDGFATMKCFLQQSSTMMQHQNLQYNHMAPSYPVYNNRPTASHFQFINDNEPQVKDDF